MTREELYDLVWSVPGTKAAQQLSVSDVYLAKICIALDVPRPPRGHWAKVAVGKVPFKPALPAASPLRPNSWVQSSRGSNDNLALLYRLKANPNASFSEVATSHAESAFAKAKPDDLGYLKPQLKSTLDLTVTAHTLQRSIELFGNLISELSSRGHQTLIASARGTVLRKQVDPRYPTTEHHPLAEQTWRTLAPTVAEVSGTPVGLAVVENCVLKLMRYVGHGTYTPEEVGLERRVVGHSWTQLLWVPSKKLQLIAYSPLSDSSWRIAWKEIEDKNCFMRIDAIVTTLEQFVASRPQSTGDRLESPVLLR